MIDLAEQVHALGKRLQLAKEGVEIPAELLPKSTQADPASNAANGNSGPKVIRGDGIWGHIRELPDFQTACLGAGLGRGFDQSGIDFSPQLPPMLAVNYPEEPKRFEAYFHGKGHGDAVLLERIELPQALELLALLVKSATPDGILRELPDLSPFRHNGQLGD